ncbi:hypothetical protein HBHAL_3854 [Halobacillus halophilus DSM 2266]|uniref:Uncharacterized protein n=1 Tax=Halobacillus halophilus (strain ATCC 35676 / DSM 2266 / JCM 20832 / KCTC 3685 / LMG 17431 / NBRC 102448 / NCIMB 2269) TaxID=866895 RepID=I0JPX7_HALH3|nr:hypothetical protein HBHAL_3854 [Halobacillus halophilus DSM 2266]
MKMLSLIFVMVRLNLKVVFCKLDDLEKARNVLDI